MGKRSIGKFFFCGDMFDLPPYLRYNETRFCAPQ